MNAFIDYVLQFGQLNQQQIDLISRKAKELVPPKEAYFSEADKVLQQVGFITEGIVRVCYYNNKGEEITKIFIEENHLLLDTRHLPFYCIFHAGLGRDFQHHYRLGAHHSESYHESPCSKTGTSQSVGFAGCNDEVSRIYGEIP